MSAGDPGYVSSRTVEDRRARDLGLAIAESLRRGFGDTLTRTLALDSEIVRETLGASVIDELRRAGYVVRFAGGHD